MKVYLSGPMRGLPHWNRYAFEKYAEIWEKEGHIVFSPLRCALALGYKFGEDEDGNQRSRLTHVIQNDVTAIIHSDAIALLPAWETSYGATVEVALAQFLCLPIFDAATMQPIDPDRKPWNELATYIEARRIRDARQDQERKHGL